MRAIIVQVAVLISRSSARVLLCRITFLTILLMSCSPGGQPISLSFGLHPQGYTVVGATDSPSVLFLASDAMEPS